MKKIKDFFTDKTVREAAWLKTKEALKKADRRIVYVAAVLILLLIPFAAMTVRPTNQTTENKTLAAFPTVMTPDGGLNLNFVGQAGEYFSERFSFRQELVALDAQIRSKIFGVSAVDSVILGENDWLYYEATLDDFQHKNSISDRMLFNIAHTLSLMQEYTRMLGKEFVFTIAPNKNSLYDENMPQMYRYQFAGQSDSERLEPWLEKEQVNYVNLFDLFAEQEEVLYYARDSHWNNRGASLVHDALLTAGNIPFKSYEELGYEAKTDYYGDLNLMLYPIGAEPETEYYYKKEFSWKYLEGAAVTDSFIRTQCEEGSGNLLMYRDSFGNTMLPFFAQTFANATFSSRVPYQMTDLITAAPNVLIVEKVERHLPTLGSVAPLMSAPARNLVGEQKELIGNKTTLQLGQEGIYWRFSGIVDEEFMDTDSRVFLEVSDGSSSGTYEAFGMQLSENGISSDYGYQMYLSNLTLTGTEFDVKVIVQNTDGFQIVYEGHVK